MKSSIKCWQSWMDGKRVLFVFPKQAKGQDYLEEQVGKVIDYRKTMIQKQHLPITVLSDQPGWLSCFFSYHCLRLHKERTIFFSQKRF